MIPDEARVGTRVTSYARTNPNDRGTIVNPRPGDDRVFSPDKFAFVLWDRDRDAACYLLSELELAPTEDPT